jgi:hypothetical protein
LIKTEIKAVNNIQKGRKKELPTKKGGFHSWEVIYDSKIPPAKKERGNLILCTCRFARK